MQMEFPFAQTAPFSDLPVAERRGKMDKKRRRVEMEKTEEMKETGEVVVEKVPWVPPPPLPAGFLMVAVKTFPPPQAVVTGAQGPKVASLVSQICMLDYIW